MKWVFQAHFTGIAALMLLIYLLASCALPYPSFA